MRSPAFCIVLLPDSSNRQVLFYPRRNCCSSTLNSFASPSEQPSIAWSALTCPDQHLTSPVLPTALFTICQLLPKDQTSTKAHYLLCSPLVFYLSVPLTDIHTSPCYFSLSQLLYLLYWCSRYTQGSLTAWVSHKNLCFSWQSCREDPYRSLAAVTQSQMLKFPCLS